MTLSHRGLSLKIPSLSANESYDKVALSTERASVLGHLMFTEESGSVAYDASGHGHHAVYGANCTVGGATWIDGSPAPLINNGFINWYGPSLAAAFNGLEFTIAGWAKANHWADATEHYLFNFMSTTTISLVRLYGRTTNNWLYALLRAEAVDEALLFNGMDGASWFHFVLAASKKSNFTRLYINGELVASSDMTGTWSGALRSINGAVIGAQTTAGDAAWGPYPMARFTLWSTALTTKQIQRLYKSASTIRPILYAGDSKMAGDQWINLFRERIRSDETGYHQQDYYGSGWRLIQEIEPLIIAHYPSESRAARYAIFGNGANEMTALPAENDYKTALRRAFDTVLARSSQTRILKTRAGRQGKDAEAATLAAWDQAVIDEYPSNVYVGPDERQWLKSTDDYATLTDDGIHYNATAQPIARDVHRAAIDYLRVVEIPGCIGFWPGRERTGTNVEDVTRRSGDATATSPVWGQTGCGDGELAVAFDGTNGGINLYTAALGAALDPDEGAMAVWIKMDNWARAAAEWLFELHADGNNRIFCYKPSGGASLTARMYSGSSGTITALSKANPSGSALLPVVVVWSRSEARFELWFNGTLADSDDLSSAPAWTGGAITTALAGCYAINTYTIDGSIARLAAFNHPLTTAQITICSTIIYT